MSRLSAKEAKLVGDSTVAFFGGEFTVFAELARDVGGGLLITGVIVRSRRRAGVVAAVAAGGFVVIAVIRGLVLAFAGVVIIAGIVTGGVRSSGVVTGGGFARSGVLLTNFIFTFPIAVVDSLGEVAHSHQSSGFANT
jgi:hypothetical protein